MKKIYQENIQKALKLNNLSQRLTYLTAILRSVLQTAVVSTFEIAREKMPADEVGLPELTDRFCHPSDGLPLQILDTLTPMLRAYFDSQFIHGWFEASKDNNRTLSKELIEWVVFRNSRTAHGVLDNDITKEWANRTVILLETCLKCFEYIIPTLTKDQKLVLPTKYKGVEIITPITRNNHAIVITKISPRKGIWKLKGQSLSLEKADEFTIDLPEDNIFNTTRLSPNIKYNLAEVTSRNTDYSFFHNIPVRQTDTFEGRKDELKKLESWMNDEDFRLCLVYGDGGYGKTTLVLEFLNQLIENKLEFERPLPVIISYYSSKMTKWTEDGLKHFTSITPAIDECIRELVRCFYPILSSDWYSASGKPLVDKAVGVLKANKITRDDVLLVIDNTETLATTSHEVKELGEFFILLGKMIGRILITSRRREFISATPIELQGLSDSEGVNLLKRLAGEYTAKSILKAGDSKLRKVSKQLMHKPILLEALVKYISRSDVGIDTALDNVFKKSNEELLEFLYEDAWARLNNLQKEVFMVIINVNSPLDQSVVSRACQEVGIQHSEFQAGLAETHFSVLTDYGRNYSMELVELAKRFFLQQFKKLSNGNQELVKSLAKSVDDYALEREKIEREYKGDRVAEAFRSEFAKAAKIHADKGENDKAVEMYKLALEDDPVNSALHDRFSWFLLNRVQDYEYAKAISKKAVDLDGNNCDAIVGLALVYYRVGDIEEGDKYIDLARDKGRPYSFCLLRKAIARFHKVKSLKTVDAQIKLLEDVLEKLREADRLNARMTGYDSKDLRDTSSYRGRASAMLTRLRTLRTRNSGKQREH